MRLREQSRRRREQRRRPRPMWSSRWTRACQGGRRRAARLVLDLQDLAQKLSQKNVDVVAAALAGETFQGRPGQPDGAEQAGEGSAMLCQRCLPSAK